MRVGILTHYYDSQNFGGNLQAYALCRALNSLGADAEQVSFFLSQKQDSLFVQEPIIRKPLYKRVLRKDIVKVATIICRNKLLDLWSARQEKKFNVTARRKAAFENFNKRQIPHSATEYLSCNIQDSLSDYDAFITGSDQVWNFSPYFKAFFLDFVPSNKKKISYAASISLPELSNEQKLIFKNSLKDFTAISVREKSAIGLIEDLAPLPVVEVVDPTLLLGKEEWDRVASPRNIEGDYIFCYFLGPDRSLRKVAKKFAKTKKMPIVYVPFAGYSPPKYADRNFGDILLFDATPNDFVSLIKHAKYVLTDSFHAVVFSHIYEKEFFVFNRGRGDKMNSRIVDITTSAGTEKRYCVGKGTMNVKYMNSVQATNYEKHRLDLAEKKQKSIDFLKNSLF